MLGVRLGPLPNAVGMRIPSEICLLCLPRRRGWLFDRAGDRGGAGPRRPVGSMKESTASTFDKYVVPCLAGFSRGGPLPNPLSAPRDI